MSQSPQSAILTHGLTKKYRGLAVVEDLNLTVTPHQVFGFLGPNGAGKSTTMKMLLGLTQPARGTVEILGQPFSQRSAKYILPHVGSLIEAPSFYGHLTGWENLDIVRRIKGVPATAINEALETVGLMYAAQKLSKEYSLGMKQRLGLAMALIGNPELLILDEPTNGLDPSGIHEIRELITSLPRARGLTVVVSSHLLSEIEQMADTIGIITHGRMLYQGPLSGLKDVGQLVVTIDEPQKITELLRFEGWDIKQVQGNEIIFPVYEDTYISQLVRTIVQAGAGVYRVEIRQRSLEETFLAMTKQTQIQTG